MQKPKNKIRTLFLTTGALGACLLSSNARAAELLMPQNRGAFYSDEAIEIAVADLPAGRKAQVEFVPDKGARTLTLPVTGQGPTVTAVLPPRALAPGEYSIRLDGKDAGKLSIASGVLSSTMLTSQTAGGMKEAGANFILSNAFSFGLLGPDGLPLKSGLRGKRSPGFEIYERAIAQDLPSICYMYWTGFVTHKPWGTEKSWANADMVRDMRLFNFHVAQRMRRYEKNILMVGTLDEPGLSWGKTPAGGMASGFPNWDEKPWYEARGWNYTQDIAAGSDADWMKYMTIRAAIIKENNSWAKRDLKAVWPNLVFSTDLYAPQAVMDGTDPLNQQVNDIPSTHVFMDWGVGKAGVIGALYLEKAHDPTAKIAHAMNGQLEGATVPQPQQRISYHVMQNGMLASGLHSNWWLNPTGMKAEDLNAVNEPAKRIGPLFQEMTPHADVAVLWGWTEAAMRQKEMAARESKKKDGEQIKLMIASWPESNEAAGTGEQSVSAYSVGGNYKEQVLNAHQAINRAGYAAHILHERILPSGVLGKYKVLMIVGQTFALPSDIQKAIGEFQKSGGVIITDSTTTQKFTGALKTAANLRDPAYRWSAVYGVTPEKNPKLTQKQASYFQTTHWMDKQARAATAPMKKVLAQTKAVPVLGSDSEWLIGERHIAGEGALLMALNSHEALPEIKDDEKYWRYNYAPLNAKFTLRGLPKSAVVYEISGLDWSRSRRLSTPLAPVNAQFEAGEMKLYLVAPRAPSGLDLKVENAGGALLVRAALKNLKMPWPFLVTIKNPAGATLFSVHRAANSKGEFSEVFPIGNNAAPGAYRVEISSPAESGKVQSNSSVVVNAQAVVPRVLNETVRVFDGATIQKFLAAKPTLAIVAGKPEYSGAAQKLAAALKAKGISAEVKSERDVMQKVLYPRIWNPFAKLYQNKGEAKLPDGADVKLRIAIDARKDGSFSARDESGKEWGDDWKQPNSLVTVGGEGFVDYVNQDHESVFEPGVQLYFDKDRALTLVKGELTQAQTTEVFKTKWSRPWNRLGSHFGGFQLPPQLPEAYDVNTHLILLGDSQSSELAAALQASELLPQVVDEKYPGAGRALVQFAWSPFAVEKNVVFIGASDAAGVNAGMSELLKLVK